MPVFALCDANNFYCSCERVFAPHLRGVPLVVLSNNDGCCIARSQEAKDLGIKMGDPWFKIEKWAVGKGVRHFSSNYVLYGDMSRRLYEVLQRFSPRVEPYSIDEMFLDLDGLGVDLVDHGRDIRSTILQETKIPTCVGIGDTKTKAKLANFLAKKRPEFGGVCDLRDPNACQRLYPTIPLDEVWGIGSASAKKLQALGLQSVADLASFDVTQGREVLTVTGARVIMELQGQSCLPLSLLSPQRKGLAVTRTFGGVRDGVGRAERNGFDLCQQGRGEAARARPAGLRDDGFHPDEPLQAGRVLQQHRDLRPGTDTGHVRPDPRRPARLPLDLPAGLSLLESGRHAE